MFITMTHMSNYVKWEGLSNLGRKLNHILAYINAHPSPLDYAQPVILVGTLNFGYVYFSSIYQPAR